MKVKIISVLSIFGISVLAKDAPPSLNSLLPTEQKDENLVFHLTFNEGEMVDLVSKEVAEVHGGSFVDDRNGNKNSAYSFDKDSRIDFPNFNKSLFDGHYTIAFWAKPKILYTFSKQVLFARTHDFGVFFTENGLSLQNEHKKIRGLDIGHSYSWNHYAFTFNGTTINTLFNGVLVSSNGHNNPNKQLEDGLSVGGILVESSNEVPLDSNGLPSFGGNEIPNMESFSGSLDDFRIYNKSLITSLKNVVINSEEPKSATSLPSLPDQELKNTIVELEQNIANLEFEVDNLNKVLSDLKSENDSLNKVNVELNNNIVVLNSNLEQATILSSTTFVEGWVYDPARGWIYTDNEHYPLVYVHSSESWYYYEIGSSNPRYFFNYSNKTWESWDDTE